MENTKLQQSLFVDTEEKIPPTALKNGNKVRKVCTLGSFQLGMVHKVDCITAMKTLPSASVDIAIADPPYNLSKGNNWKWDNSVKLPGFGGDWKKVMADWDDMPLGDYFSFCLCWLAELKRVVKSTGSIWIHGTYHNIGIINFALQLLEIEIINEVVWYKRNSFPNLSGRRLTASHETIIWAHTGGPKGRKYYFNYEMSKDMPCPEDLLKQAGKQMRTLWDIPNNKKQNELEFGKHPTQKPVRLLTRMIQLSARPGDILLVPFAGAGSDCVAAKDLGVNFLAFETEEEFVEISKKRLSISCSKSQKLNGSSSASKEKKHSPKSTISRTQHCPRKAKNIPSLIKWTGSKRSQASSIAELMPSYSRYFEPFVGSGALLYLAACPGAVAGDIYKPLVDLWTLIKTDPEQVISNYSSQWKKLDTELDSVDVKSMEKGNGVPKYFYRIRDRFNKDPNPLDLNFLMRTCVNGIVRFNDEGLFNNSFHLSRRGMQPERFASAVRQWSSVIQGVSFVCGNYTKTLAEVQSGDFVYFDPPYAGNKQRYVRDLDLEAFFNELEKLNRNNIKWALSFDGHRGSENFTHHVPRELYKRHLYLPSGNSAVNKVLNGPVEAVRESLYLNY